MLEGLLFDSACARSATLADPGRSFRALHCGNHGIGVAVDFMGLALAMCDMIHWGGVPDVPLPVVTPPSVAGSPGVTGPGVSFGQNRVDTTCTGSASTGNGEHASYGGEAYALGNGGRACVSVHVMETDRPGTGWSLTECPAVDPTVWTDGTLVGVCIEADPVTFVPVTSMPVVTLPTLTPPGVTYAPPPPPTLDTTSPCPVGQDPSVTWFGTTVGTCESVAVTPDAYSRVHLCHGAGVTVFTTWSGGEQVCVR